MTKKLAPFLCCFIILLLTNCGDDEDVILSEYNTNCQSDCLIIYGSVSPSDLISNLTDARLQVTRRDPLGYDEDIAFTRPSLQNDRYRIAVPRVDLVDYLPVIDIGILGTNFIPYAPQYPLAEFNAQTLPDSIEVNLTCVPWAILNMQISSPEESISAVSFQLLAANGKMHEEDILGPFDPAEKSILTYADRELTLVINYTINGQLKEKTQPLILPARQDTAFEFILD